MTKEQKATAYEFGQKAFHQGIKSAPCLDADFLRDMIAGLKMGEGLPLYDAWTAGWHYENLRA